MPVLLKFYNVSADFPISFHKLNVHSFICILPRGSNRAADAIEEVLDAVE